MVVHRRGTTPMRRLLPLALPAVLLGFLGGKKTFLPSPSVRPSASRLARTRLGASRVYDDPDDDEYEWVEEEYEDDLTYPRWMDAPGGMRPEDLYELDDKGNILRQYYLGSRDAATIISALFCTLVGPGFLIVGLSLFFDESIVDWSPITSKLLWFLRIGDQGYLPIGERVGFYPAGIFLIAWGLIFAFLMGPTFLYLVFSDAGRGVFEVNKKRKKVYVVKNNELIRDLDFKDIQNVQMRYANNNDEFLVDLPGDDREVVIVMKDGTYIDIEDKKALQTSDRSKAAIEVKASRLARYIGVPLSVVDVQG